MQELRLALSHPAPPLLHVPAARQITADHFFVLTRLSLTANDAVTNINGVTTCLWGTEAGVAHPNPAGLQQQIHE